jgi:hypothetical protein
MALQVKAVQLQCGTFPRSNGDADANSASRGSNMVGRQILGAAQNCRGESSSSSSLQMSATPEPEVRTVLNL